MMPVILCIWLLVVLAGLALEWLDLRHLARHGGEVPPELAETVDAATLRRISDYTLDRGRLRLVKSVALHAVTGLFVFAGGLALYDHWIAVLATRIAAAATGGAAGVPGSTLAFGPHRSRFIFDGVLFLLGLVVLETLLEMPFGLWSSFRVEARHGFNRTSGRLWLADEVKGLLLSLVLGTIVASVALSLVGWSPDRWWLHVWGFCLVFGIFLMYVSPYVIEPLFFKFKPIESPGLEEGIRDLAARAGLRVSRVLQVDASRRSRHSNAYFTGIGPVKRIVLFDTLLASMQPDEVLAVLAHEMGHWKLRHVLRRLVLLEIVALVTLFLAFELLRWRGLPGLVGLEMATFPARVLIVGFLASLLALPLAPLASMLSRRDEHAADRYACRLTGASAELASAVARLGRDNLSNLHPHPLYARLFYSHPPLVERIRALRAAPSATGRGPA